MYKGKVFHLGLSKTGTTSFNEAMRLLGYRCRHNPSLFKKDKNAFHYYTKKYDVLTDVPVVLMRKKLHKAFPDAKWVVTVREREPWLKSCQTHFHWRPTMKSKTMRRVREMAYGSVYPSADQFIQAHIKWYKIINDFVKDKDHIVMDICSGNETWDNLCKLLDCPIPDIPFPHANTSSDRIKRLKRQGTWDKVKHKKDTRFWKT